MVDCWKKNRRLNLVRLYFNIFPVTFWNSLLTFFLSVIYFITFPPDFLPQSRHCMCRGQGAGCRWLSRWRLNITNIPSSLEAGQPDTPPNRETAFTINGDPVWWLWKGIFQVSSPLPSSPPPPPQALPSPGNILYSPSPGYVYKKCYLEYKWARMFSCCVIPIIYSYILTIYSANPFLLQKNLESLIVLYSICFVVRFCVYLKITKLHSRPSIYVAKIQLKQAFA